ncbi:hypothetical protein Q5O14_11135 [Eubacteriaceae bacterium ES2]|nr:hypothetical protein Q5O14_11135 [Eubacteriaceae bacterium ES2]
MKKKTAITVLVIIIIGAMFLGFLLVNKGDGPIMGMVLGDTAIESTEAYDKTVQELGDGIYLVLSSAFNKYQEDFSMVIPEGDDLYANLHFVESPQGSEFTGKWIKDGNIIGEEVGTLSTGPEGIISYMIDGNEVVEGSYAFELYDGDERIFEITFSIE